jgi:hypothetical protein
MRDQTLVLCVCMDNAAHADKLVLMFHYGYSKVLEL